MFLVGCGDSILTVRARFVSKNESRKGVKRVCINLVPRTPNSSAWSQVLFQLAAMKSVAQTMVREGCVLASRTVRFQSFLNTSVLASCIAREASVEFSRHTPR